MTTAMKFSGKCSRLETNPSDILVFGSVAFPNMPTFSERVTTSRREGVSVKQHNVSLNGFVRGTNHYEVRILLSALRSFSKYNHLRFTYSAGNLSIINKQVYIDSVVEPQDWKEYNAKYTITFHYFSCPCEEDTVASPVTALLQDGTTYTFNPQPIFSVTSNDIRGGQFSCKKTLYDDTEIGKKVTKVFTGILCEATHADLKLKMDALDEAIRGDFVLAYGDWSEWVFVEKTPAYQISDFTTHATYQFTVSYYDKEIARYESKIKFTRQHRYPKVTPRLYCGKTDVDTFHESGQYVTYTLTILSFDKTRTRLKLGQEFDLMVAGGGTMMDGGTEDWNDDGSMTVTNMYYYKVPILPLVEVNQDIATDFVQYKCERTEPTP